MKRLLCFLCLALCGQTVFSQAVLPHRRTAFRSTVAAVPPADDTNDLQFWFRGDTLEGTYEGATTNTWLDSSPNGWYLTNVIAECYPYITNTFNGVANRKALVFNGTTNYLYVTNATAKNIARNGSNSFLVVVCHVYDTTGSKFLWNLSYGVTYGPRETIFFDGPERFTADGRSLDGDVVLEKYVATGSSTAKAAVYSVEFNHTNKVAVTGGILNVYTNNVLGVTGSGGTMSATNTSDTASKEIALGGFGNTANLFFKGAVAELRYYSPALSDTRRTNVYNFLVNKYTIVR